MVRLHVLWKEIHWRSYKPKRPDMVFHATTAAHKNTAGNRCILTVVFLICLVAQRQIVQKYFTALVDPVVMCVWDYGTEAILHVPNTAKTLDCVQFLFSIKIIADVVVPDLTRSGCIFFLDEKQDGNVSAVSATSPKYIAFFPASMLACRFAAFPRRLKQ